jgi:hypothetical protein
MKVITGLVAAFLLVLGLTSAPANATVYPHSIATTCHASPAGGAHVNFKMTAGTGKPKATVYIKVINRLGRVVKRLTRYYRGVPVVWYVGPLRDGRYKVAFTTRTGPTSVYKNCSTSTRIRVS